jgi:hypothetical protein
MELALQALESQRAVMYDPTKKYFFLQYTDGAGNKNGTIYNEPLVWRAPPAKAPARAP